MKQASNTAPLLLIAAMLFSILFRHVLLGLGQVRYMPGEYPGEYIIYNGVQYVPDRFFVLAFTLHIFAFILPAIFYVKLFRHEGYIKGLDIKLPRARDISVLIYGLGALLSGAALVNSLIFQAFGPLELRASVIDLGGNPLYNISAAAAFVLLPAVCEEFLFRAVLPREYAQHGALCACIISAAAFAMLRFSLALFPVYFMAGVILYIIARVSGSLLFAIIARAGFGFFNIYAWGRFAAVLHFEQNRFIFSFLAAVIFIIFMLALLHKVEHIYYYKASAGDPPHEGAAARLPALRAASATLAAAALVYFLGVNL